MSKRLDRGLGRERDSIDLLDFSRHRAALVAMVAMVAMVMGAWGHHLPLGELSLLWSIHCCCCLREVKRDQSLTVTWKCCRPKESR